MIRWLVRTIDATGGWVALGDVEARDKRAAREVAGRRWPQVDVFVIVSHAELEIIAEEQAALARGRTPPEVSAYARRTGNGREGDR